MAERAGGAGLDRFRAAYLRNIEALNRGDLGAAFAWVRPEFEWYVVSVPEGPEAPPVLRGPDEVKGFFAVQRDQWGYRIEAREFVDPGDGTVVVRATGQIEGRTSGLRAEVHFRQVWELDETGVPLRAREQVDDYFLERLPGPDRNPPKTG